MSQSKIQKGGEKQMTCEEFRERLSELIDHTLSEEQEARMYAHAEKCGDCEELLRQTTQLV